MILSYHISSDGIFVSNGKHQPEPPYIDFLLSQGQGKLNVCYHLDYNVSCLLVLLKFTPEQLIEIYNTSELRVHGYFFKYIPKKFLSIAHKDKFAVFSDASQYMERWDVKYGTPQEKCKEALDIAQSVYDALRNLGVFPKTLVSPISAFEKHYMTKLDIPTIDDMPIQAAEYAYNCTHGPWVECFKRGLFKNVYDYDLSSAYGSQLANSCIDFRLGEWSFVEQFDADAYYGYYKGIVNITSDFSPIIYSKTNEMSYTPKGEWKTYLTQEEIKFITKYNIGTFEIEDGWVFHPTKIYYPYRPLVLWLFSKKEKATGMDKRVCKRILAALWGYSLSIMFDGSMGQYFSPCVGAEVESRTRLEVARFIIENDLIDHVLSIAVDGVLTDKEVRLE
jgi:hypothetical protein